MTHSGRGTGGGGAATAGGINFQAAVTAIVAAHIASGQRLGWLDAHVNDVPISLWSESGGAGDDLRLTLSSGTIVEVQVKKGLEAGRRLWESLEALARGIHTGSTMYGVLVVCPDTGRPVAARLANDIVRLGGGRTDGISAHGLTLLKRLTALKLPAVTICQRLRIRRVHALTHDGADIQTARGQLAHIVDQRENAGDAWDKLYAAGHGSIERRGAMDAQSVLRLLENERIMFAADTDTPAGHLVRLTAWTKAVNSTLSMVGSPIGVPITRVWFDLAAARVNHDAHSARTLQEALEHYHSRNRGLARNDDAFDALTVGRFRTLAVIVGGPGMGKTTLSRRLALEYAGDGFPVLHVPLRFVATRIKKSGVGFEAAAFGIGLDAAGLNSDQLVRAGIRNWVLVCDGLDETGALQDTVAEGAVRFAAAHPMARVIITTRPIGYCTGWLSSWAHYQLRWPAQSTARSCFTRLVKYLSAASTPDVESLTEQSLESPHIESFITRSPLMTALVAALVARGRRVPNTVTELYGDILRLVVDEPPPRVAALDGPPRPTRERVLFSLGWYLQHQPLATSGDIWQYCGRTLANQLGCTRAAAEDMVDRCLLYWQEIGIVERVHHGLHETLTFVHKAVGEFAAAKHLVSLPEPLRAQAIAQCDALREVQGFAASLGLATEIADRVLNSATTPAEHLAAVERTLQIIEESDEPVDAPLRRRAIAAAYDIVQSDDRASAVRVGCALADAASKVPGEISTQSVHLKKHEQTWTRLAAWACLVAGSPDQYSVTELRDSLQQFSGLVGTIELPLGPALVIREYTEARLAERFALSALNAVVESWPEQIDDFMPVFIDVASKGTMGHLLSTTRLLRRFGRSSEAERLSSLMDSGRFQTLEAASKRVRAFGQAILKSLATLVDPFPVSRATASGSFFHVSAFFTSIGYRHLELSDTMEFSSAVATKVLDVVVRAWADASAIPRDQLLAEARALIETLSTSGAPETEPTFMRFVDVDDPDFSKVQLSDDDFEYLERALHMPSSFIVTLATNCLDCTCVGDRRRKLLERVLEKGCGWSLGAAAYMVRTLPPSEAVSLLLGRLAKWMTDGCSFLFDRLCSLSPLLDEGLTLALRRGLVFDAPIGEAAASVAAIHARPGQNELQHVLQDAYAYWTTVHDRVVVTASPRAKIVEALWAIEAPGLPALVRHCVDHRSDIRDLSRQMLMQTLRASPEARAQFTQMTVDGIAPAHCLAMVLQEKVPLSPNDIAALRRLLEHADPEYRWAAMHLLNKTYLLPNEIAVHTERLSRDPDHRIRERANEPFDHSHSIVAGGLEPTP